MGLLDGFDNIFDSAGGRLGLGLLAAGSARADGAGAGQRLAEAIGSVDQWKQQQALAKRQAMQDQMMQMQMAQAQKAAADEAKMRELAPQYFKQGSQALAPLSGDPSTGILPSQGRAAIPSSFDSRGFAGALMQNGQYKPAMEILNSLQKEAPVNKLDVKDFKPESVQKFLQTGNYGDLVRLDKAAIHNTGGATVALDPFTGQPLNSIRNTQSPDSVASNGLGWANFGLSRQRLAMEQNNQDKPQWNESLGGFVDPRQRVVRPALDTQGNPIQSSKPLTDVQAKALQFGSRMAEADRLLNGLAKAGTDQPGVIKRTAESVPWVGNGLGVIANGTQSDSQQNVEQAQRDFVNAVLRRESGAAISPSEFDSAKKQYFPQPFDSEAVKQQKARNRALSIQGIMAEVPGQSRNMLQTNQPQNSSDPLGLFTR